MLYPFWWISLYASFDIKYFLVDFILPTNYMSMDLWDLTLWLQITYLSIQPTNLYILQFYASAVHDEFGATIRQTWLPQELHYTLLCSDALLWKLFEWSARKAKCSRWICTVRKKSLKKKTNHQHPQSTQEISYSE